jgi:RHS repeat-associated protein
MWIASFPRRRFFATLALLVSAAAALPSWAQPPLLSLQPADGSLLGSRTGTLTGRAPGAVLLQVDGNQLAVGADGSFSHAFSLPEGESALSIYAEDAEGLSVSQVHHLEVDSLAPGIVVSAPAQTRVGATPVEVAGTVQEAHLAGVTVRGSPAGLSGNSFSATVVLAEGAQNVAIVATDDLGRSTTVTLVLTLDTQAPTIAVAEAGTPFAGGLYDRPVTPQITLGDAGSFTSEILLDGSPYESGTQIAAEGAHRLEIAATDAVGNSASREIDFTLDFAAPSIGQISPAAGAVLAGATVTLQVEATGAASVKVGSQQGSASGNVWSIGPLSLAEGSQELVIEAFDAAGNRAERRHALIRDTTAPSLQIVAPAQNAVLTASPALITGSAADPRLASVRVNGELASLTGSNFSISVALEEGANGFAVEALDSAGNASNQTLNLTLDTTAPSFTVKVGGVALAGGEVFSAAITPTIELSEPAATVTATLDGASFTFGAAISADGDHQLGVTVSHNGLSSSNLFSFRIDRQAPVFGALSPAEGSVLAAASVLLEGSVQHAASLTVDGVPVALANGAFTGGPYTLAAGVSRTFVLLATSAGGLTTEKRLTVVQDGTQPQLAILQPAADALIGAATVTVSGTASDPHLLRVRVSGIDAQVSASSWLASGVSLAEGSNSLTVVAEDRAGNQRQMTRTVVRDTTDPQVSITEPAAGTVVPAAAYTVRGTATDAHLDRVEVNGRRATLQGSDFHLEVALVEGANNVEAAAIDKLGRRSTASVTITRDSDAPQVQIQVPAEGFATRAASIEVRGAYENEAGTTVKVNGLVAVLTTGHFEALAVPLVPGENRITARAVDAQGNEGVHTRTVWRDEIAPTFVRLEPAAGALSLPVNAVFRISFSEEMAEPETGAILLATAAGAALPFAVEVQGKDLVLTPSAPLPPQTTLRLTLTAGLEDRAGNALSPVPAYFELTTADTGAPGAPVLSATPAATGCRRSVLLAGTAEALAQVRAEGGAAAALTRAGEDGAFSLEVQLLPEQPSVIRLVAIDSLGNESPELVLQLAADCTPPRVESAEIAGAAITVTFSEAVSAPAGAFRLASAGGAEAFGYALSGSVATLTLGAAPSGLLELAVGEPGGGTVEDLAGNDLAFPWRRLFGAGAGDSFVAGTVFDDGKGQPLAGALVSVTTTNGVALADPLPQVTTAADGRFLLGLPAGTHDLTFARPGYAPVFRVVTTAAGEGTHVFDPRLTLLNLPSPIGAAGGAAVDGVARLELPAGAFASDQATSITQLSEQALPALLPYGFSPRGAVYVAMAATPSVPGTLTIPVETATGREVVVASLDFALLQWKALAVETVAGGSLEIEIDAPGAYVVIEADAESATFLQAVVGQVLPSLPAPEGDEIEAAAVDFAPTQVLPSQRSRATVSYTLKGAGTPAPSGLPLTLAVQERLTLLDGSERRAVPYSADLLVFRAPDGEPRSRFWLQPSPLAASLPIEIGAEDVSIRTFGETTVRGNILGPDGGSVLGSQGDLFEVPAGALTRPTAVTVRRRTVGDLTHAAPAGFPVLGVVEVDLGGLQLAGIGRLTLATEDPPAAGSRGLLLGTEDIDGQPKWRALAELEPVAAGWRTVASGGTSPPWPGVRQGGFYLAIELEGDWGLLEGELYDSDQELAAGGLISSVAVPFIQVSNADGTYVIPLPAGATVVIQARDARRDQVSVEIPALTDLERRVFDLEVLATGPTVVEIEPADGAANVPTSFLPRVVFSESIDRASLDEGVRMSRGGEPVAIEIDHQDETIVIDPVASLLPDTTYQLEIGTEVADLQGRQLSSPRSVSFHTTAAPPPTPGIDATKLRLYEPDFEGNAKVVGLPGAVPNASLLWVENFETITITAEADGSFELEVPATVGDDLFLTVLVPGQSAAVRLLGPWLVRGDQGAYIDGEGGSFKTSLGFEVAVERGTFETLTRVAVAAKPAPIATSSSFTALLDFELDLGGAVARRPILIRLPVPAGSPAGSTYLLSRYLEALGRRGWMAMDLLRREGDILTNEQVGAAGAGSVVAKATASATMRFENPAARVLTSGEMEDLRHHRFLPRAAAPLGAPEAAGLPAELVPRGAALLPKSSVGQGVGLPGLRGSGRYQLSRTSSSISWLTIPAVGQMLAISPLSDGPPFLGMSLDSYLGEHLPNLVLPRVGDEATQLEVLDLNTGYTVYEGVLPPSPDPVMALPPDLVSDHQPPVVVGGSPLRFSVIQTAAEGEIDLGNGVQAQVAGGTVTVTGMAEAASPGAQVKLFGLDASKETQVEANQDGSFTVSIQVSGQERILLAIGGKVGPSERIRLTFSEQVVELQGVELFPVENGLATTQPISLRKVAVDQGVSWQIVPATGWRAGDYQLRIDSGLRDGAGNAWPRPFTLDLEVPRASSIHTIEVPRFADFDRLGTVLAIAGNDGGLRIFDASNPADPSPFMASDHGYRFAGGGAVRGVRFDEHGRMVVVGSGEKFAGQLHVIDLLDLDREATNVSAAFGDAVWGNTSISSPISQLNPVFPALGMVRRVATLSSDNRKTFALGDQPPAGVLVTTTPVGTEGELIATVVGETEDGHAPVSLHNHTRGRWGRTYSGAGAQFDVDVKAREGDQLELVRNRGTWAYATIDGFGIASVKLDAIRGGVGSDLLALGKARFTRGYRLELAPVCDPGRPLTDPTPVDLEALPGATTAAGLQPPVLVTMVQGYGLAIYQIESSDPRELSELSTACGAVDNFALVTGMEVVTGYGFDFDGDGHIRTGPEIGPSGATLPSEVRDYAVLSHAKGWLLIFDVTKRSTPFLAGRIKIGKLGHDLQISRLAVDRTSRKIYVGAFGSGLYVADFDAPPRIGSIDADNDQYDDRVIDNIQIGSEEFIDALAFPELGIVWAAGRNRGVSSIAIGGPKLRVVAADGGPPREVRSLAPFGVPTAPEGESANQQAGVFSVQTQLASDQAEIEIQVSGIGPGGSPIDPAGQLEDIPAPQIFETLRRQANQPWEKGATTYISKKMAAIADLRASVTYDASEDELQVCARCSQVEQGVYSGVPEPSQRLKEVLSGKQISVDFAGPDRELLAGVYADQLAKAVEVKSIPWQPSPAITQEPPQNVVKGGVPGALLHSGELAAREIDLETPSRNMSLSFERSYRSQTVGATALGPGWDHNFNVRLRELPTGDVELFDGAGRRDLFAKKPDGTFETPAGRFEALTKSGQGFTLVEPQKVQLQFDIDGRLDKVKDALSTTEGKGNEIQLSYDGKSRLKTIQDPQDRAITFDYDDQGRLEKLRDHSGRAWDYGYDAKGQLVTVKSPAVDLGAGAQRPEKGYSYSPGSSGDIRERLNQLGQLNAVKKPDGRTWLTATFTDADGDGLPEEIQSQQLGPGTLSVVIDKAARLATVTDLRGHLSKYNFNTAGQPTRFEDATGAVWLYEYNGDGLVTKVTEPLGRVTDYLYATGEDARVRANLIETRVHADSRGTGGSPETLVTQTSYDPVSNQPSRIVDPRGNVTSIVRSPEGLPLQILRGEGTPEATSVTFTYNEYGQVRQHVDGNGNRIEYTYYLEGFQQGFLRSKVIDPAGAALTTTYDVDARGFVRAITDGRGVRSEIDYNDLGWKTVTRQAVTGSEDESAPPLGYVTRWQYDENGNVLAVEVPYGDGSEHTVQSFEYGLLNELKVVRRQIEPRNPQKNWIVEPENWIAESREYDNNLNLVATVDGEGHRQEVEYDPRNLPEVVTRGLGTGALPEPLVESFVYDAERQLRLWVDGRGKQWEQLYDGYARPAEQRDPLGNKSRTEYDANSNPSMQRMFDAEGNLLAAGGAIYDNLDRRRTATSYLWDPEDPLLDPQNPLALARPISTQFAYDRVGNLRTVTDPLGRVSERRYDTAGRLYEALDPAGNRQNFFFDDASNLTSVTQHDVSAGGVIATTTTFAYDALGREVQSTDALGNKVQSSYDAAHQLVQVIDQENHFTTFDYDGLGRQVRETRPEGIDIRRSYDRAGRLTEYRDAKNQATTYQYDAANRQIGITYPDNESESFEYDAAGNLEKRVDALGNQITSTYDNANRLISRSASVNVSAGVEGPFTETYSWDGLGRLRQAQSGGVVTERHFDPLSRLVKESTNGRLVRYQMNDAGLPEATIYPSGFKVDREFDALNRPLQVSHDNDLIGLFQYRGPGAVEKTTYGNGLVRNTTFDALTRPLSSTVGKIDLPAVFSEQTVWTPRSLKAGVARADQNGFGKIFQYDGAARVLGVGERPLALSGLQNNTVPSGELIASAPKAENFEYDAAQNLLRSKERKDENEITVETPPDESGRNRPASVGGRELEWDANGNLRKKDNLRFAYDWRNRLKKVTEADGGALVATYTYDVFNRRVEKEVGGTTYGYAWDGWNQIEDSVNDPNQVRNRRVYGLGLDNALRMDFDLNGSGGPDAQYVPVYDGIGNLIALTNAAGKPVERYEYSAYGKQKIFVDNTPPQINQIRKVGSTFLIEMSEEVSLTEIQRQIEEGEISLVGTGVGFSYPLTASQPVQEGPLARRRIALATTATIADNQEVTLKIGANTLADGFLNTAPAVDKVHTLDWGTESVLEDNTAPSVQRIAVRDGKIEIDFDEAVDAALAAQAITIDGGVVAWTLSTSGYQMVANAAVSSGAHDLEVGLGTIDLAGSGLATVFHLALTVDPQSFEIAFEAADSRAVLASTVANRFGFQGLPADFETNFLYVRNRYYVPELSRFASADPLGFVDGPSAYQMTLNNPVNLADPLGLFWDISGPIRAGRALLDGLSGVAQGIAGSVMQGYLEEANPKNSDTVPQRIGQGIGAALTMVGGGAGAATGAVATVTSCVTAVGGAAPSGGASLALLPACGASATATTASANAAVGGYRYMSEMSNTGTSSESSGQSGQSGGNSDNPADQPLDSEGLPLQDSVDWDAVVPRRGPYRGQNRRDHIRLHNVDNPNKVEHGVFLEDGVAVTNEAWEKAKGLGITHTRNGEITVPMGRQVGWSGGLEGSEAPIPLTSVTIKVVPGTNRIITAYPDI